MRVLSFDPGETSGWAYDEGKEGYPGSLLNLGQLGMDQVFPFFQQWDLEKNPVDVLVVEGYLIYDLKANFGSQVPTVEMLGIAKGWALHHKIKTHVYFSKDINNVAKIVGVNPRKGAHRNTHWLFAANYGRHFLIKSGNAKGALAQKMGI